jgi:TetR/AcrR family transcriptional repressor of lmrAB and yxaGH operons
MDDLTTRDRLIVAMSDALQRRGMNGMGLSELLADARAPKGVLYHHFPGGKSELTVAAIGFTVERMLARLDRLAAQFPDPLAGLVHWMGDAQKMLDDSGFERGCPLATVALEATPDDVAIRDALAAGFGAIRARIAAMLTAPGRTPAEAQGVATLIVAAYEGGLLQARVERSVKPMREVCQTLVTLLGGLPPAGATR